MIYMQCMNRDIIREHDDGKQLCPSFRGTGICQGGGRSRQTASASGRTSFMGIQGKLRVRKPQSGGRFRGSRERASNWITRDSQRNPSST